MQRDSSAFAVPVLGVAVGIAVLLWAEASGAGDVMLLVGGAVMLASVGLLTAMIASLPDPPGGAHD